MTLCLFLFKETDRVSSLALSWQTATEMQKPFFFFFCISQHLSPSPSSQIDRLEVSGLVQAPAVAVSCAADGSLPGGEDGTPDPQRTKQAIAQLQQKILKLTEQIKIEQTVRDDNVAEYLELANNADKQQSARIKQVR